MIARSRSTPLMVSAAAPDGAIGRRETRGGTGQPGAWRTTPSAARRRRPPAQRPRASTTRRHSGRVAAARAGAVRGRRRERAPCPGRTARRRCRRSRCRRSFSRQRCSSVRIGGGTSAGSAVPVRLELRSTAPSMSRHVLAVERRACPSASRTARSRTPRCRCACPPRRPFACSGAMYAAVPRIMPTPVIIAGDVIVGDCR